MENQEIALLAKDLPCLGGTLQAGTRVEVIEAWVGNYEHQIELPSGEVVLVHDSFLTITPVG